MKSVTLKPVDKYIQAEFFGKSIVRISFGEEKSKFPTLSKKYSFLNVNLLIFKIPNSIFYHADLALSLMWADLDFSFSPFCWDNRWLRTKNTLISSFGPFHLNLSNLNKII